MPASWLKGSLRRMGLDPENLPPPPGVSELPEGKTPWRDVWSGGQGVGLIDDIPTVAELVRRLQGEYLAACGIPRSEEHTSELQSLMRISYAVFCLKKKNNSIYINYFHSSLKLF